MHDGKLDQCLVESNQIFRRFGQAGNFVQLAPDESATPFLALLSPGLIDEDSADCDRRGGEEMTSTIPLFGVRPSHQPHIGFVDEGCRLQGLTGLFVRQLRRGKLSQFVIDEWKKPVLRLRITFFQCVHDFREFAHQATVRFSCRRLLSWIRSASKGLR